MACPLFPITIFIFLSVAAPVILAGVSVLTPLDNQLPLVARIGQPYSWSISSKTFGGCEDALSYKVSDLPSWLSFDPATPSFSGTPSDADDGDIDVTVSASCAGKTTSSWFSLSVTGNAPPTLKTPILSQLYDGNPSLASAFAVGPESLLCTSNPAVRIPPRWSFSIGLEGDTYTYSSDVYYQVLQADGTEIPYWMSWNPHDYTLTGVTPRPEDISTPTVYNLVLHASDIKGATADTQAFDVILAEHDVSMTKQFLPTVNVTANSPFDVPLTSVDDFSGVLVDAQPIHPDDLALVHVDTGSWNWIKYDDNTRHLSGDAPAQVDQHPVLPVEIHVFNQTIHTNLSLAVVPSFFTNEDLPTLVVPDDGHVDFALQRYFSNKTSNSLKDIDLSTSFTPREAGDVLHIDQSSFLLSGTLPHEFPSKNINLTITAYSRVTHSTSHASMPITYQSADTHNKNEIGRGDGRPSGIHMSKKVAMALGITFGVVGGLIALGVCLACCRRGMRVRDTALSIEEGQQAYSEKDKRWYGIGTETVERKAPPNSPILNALQGLGLHRVLERSGSGDTKASSVKASTIVSPSSGGHMPKKEFLLKVKDTMRSFSDSYSKRRRPQLNRPVIGKPILISHDESSDSLSGSPPNRFLDTPAHSILRNSTSTASDDHSIPRQRVDCLTPPTTVHFANQRSIRDSEMSLDYPMEEAVVQLASKANTSRASIRSAMSMASDIANPPVPLMRPRLVPFTSSSRVPMPSMSIASPTDSNELDNSLRIVSQTALVDAGAKQSGDDLSVGIHYVRALGQSNASAPGSTLTVSTNVRSSFSSLETSHDGHESMAIVRMVVRAGERFKFKVPLEPYDGDMSRMVRRMEARKMDGRALPKFLHADLSGRKNSDAAEFYGVALSGDVGELDVGVFEAGVCVGRVVLEVTGR
ncbi:hypothetical protein CYLTODRAFT_493752 [Cylindrobasidium torrendii FP15055 ss-10]|uniref:Dystroglycan-type cadherin-like domain-containing protein n=1 Tax=Cylindrobasidium torrendii FP15055 ss-10 TaxID=1314674 RepID=A0A0D7B085_9AGAR|nr:hypothetical protein CYLTODRAFT_493752 [Cylindrobasidium torrendii FP15055 ss-10]